MERQQIGRRQVLRTAGLTAGGVALATATTSAAASADGRETVVGSWRITAEVDNGGPTVINTTSFTTGGVAVSHDIKPANVPFLGSWARTRGAGFRATVWSGVVGPTGPGSVGDTLSVEIVGRLRHDDTISGTFTVTDFAIDDSIAFAVTGTFTGTRIAA